MSDISMEDVRLQLADIQARLRALELVTAYGLATVKHVNKSFAAEMRAAASGALLDPTPGGEAVNAAVSALVTQIEHIAAHSVSGAF